jgi:hypothetical protein
MMPRPLAEGIELEDLVAIAEDESEENENCEGWIDEQEEMTSEEQDELEESVRPLTRVLVKVSSAVEFRSDPSLMVTHDNACPSYESLRLRSSIRRRFSCLCGLAFSMPSK